ncbi:MAG: hypothetical protein LQ347_004944 [Umbilicaria vellea]|nr:MAG: hypothetical protein LQ347_004944 [Umbilicaria vellea]
MSHKHPTLCTVIVDGPQPTKGTTSPTPQAEERQWRLPSTDPRDEGKFLFRLHTIDIYFWKLDAARSFVDALGNILGQDQLSILDAPLAPAADEAKMSPVVQQLENVAFTDPAYHNGQTRSSRTAMNETSLPPAVSIKTSQHNEHQQEMPAATKSPETYAPLAYNPAAPPAPEPIKHREKTPPPPESESGTGLAAAAYNDHVNAYAQPVSHHQSSFSPQLQSPQSYPGPPWQASSRASVSSSTTFPTSPSPFTQGQRTSSVSSYPPPPPPQSATGKSSPYPQHHTPSFAPPPQNPNAHFLGGNTTPMESPATEVIGNSYVDHSKQPLQHLQPQYADYLQSRPASQETPGGYSNYQYGQPHHHHSHHSHGDPNDIHSQVYRPTEEEAKSHGSHRKKSTAGPAQQPGRIEEKVDRAEKGVNRFLKRLEKKIG